MAAGTAQAAEVREGAGGGESGGGGAQLLDPLPMRAAQILVVAITIALNALDGFDVLAISFASPGIASEWRIDRAALGIVLSMELIGMAIGSVLLGRLGDRWGRKPTALLALAMMVAGMLLAAGATGIGDLSAYRIITGLGIGGMLAVTNAIASEVSNTRHRSLCVSLMVIGYPIGAILGGMATGWLLQSHDWRIIFTFGAACTAVMIPVVYLLVPETPAFLISRRAPDALARLNRSLGKLGHAPLALLPDAPAKPAHQSILGLFAPGLGRTTLLLTIAYFAQIITFYFILKWTPKIVVDMGFAPSTAAGVLVWANVGGALGGALFGVVTRFASLKLTSLFAFAGSAVMVAVFGTAGADLGTLSLLAGIGGFCTNAAMVGLYNISAASFPTALRATGTGFVIGMGRGGAVLGPPLAGMLFEAGLSLPMVAMAMATGSLVAMGAVAAMRLER